MITANEAREMAETVCSNRREKTISKIDKRIRKSSMKGRFFIEVFSLSHGVLDYLKEKGFRVHFDEYDHEYTISWDE